MNQDTFVIEDEISYREVSKEFHVDVPNRNYIRKFDRNFCKFDMKK